MILRPGDCLRFTILFGLRQSFRNFKRLGKYCDCACHDTSFPPHSDLQRHRHRKTCGTISAALLVGQRRRRAAISLYDTCFQSGCRNASGLQDVKPLLWKGRKQALFRFVFVGNQRLRWGTFQLASEWAFPNSTGPPRLEISKMIVPFPDGSPGLGSGHGAHEPRPPLQGRQRKREKNRLLDALVLRARVNVAGKTALSRVLVSKIAGCHFQDFAYDPARSGRSMATTYMYRPPLIPCR